MIEWLKTDLRRNPWVWAIAALLGVLDLAVAGRYDAFRNELYYIVCGRHPDWGYVDQPPLVPLLAAATQLFGDHVWLLRLPAVIAAFALVVVTGAFARLLGGGERAAGIAALAAGIAPMLMALTSVLTTSTFEQLGWTACAYYLARSVMTGDRRALIWAGLIAGLSFEAKYSIAIWLIGLGLGLAMTRERSLFVTRQLWLGVGIGAVAAAPSLVWQAVHGWPFFEVIGHAREAGTNFTGTPVHFLIHQVFALNPLLAPLWLAGIVAPFVMKELRPVRFLAVAYVVAAAIVIGAHGKDYYLAPAYPTLFAIGALACARLNRWLQAAWLTGAVALSAFAAPVVLPILDPPVLARYMEATHLKPAPDELAAVGAPLTQVFSDELGWRAMEQQVAAAYNALSPEDKARVAIIAVDYGEAAALDVYGAADGLPPALSGQDQYFLWGAHGHDGSVILHINGEPETWQRFCQSLEIVGQIGAPYVMPYENDRPIMLCRGLHRPLGDTWERFKRYN